MLRARQRLEALAKTGSQLPRILAEGESHPAPPDASLAAAGFPDSQLLQMLNLWLLAERGEWQKALEPLAAMGTLRPGLERVRRDLAAQARATLGSAAVSHFPHGDGRQGAPEVESDGVPEDQTTVPGATVSLSLQAWLTRVQAWREVLGV